eukprot:gene46061-56386_t
MLFLSLFFVAFMMVSQVMGDTCGGNCPSDGCSSCPCGTATNYVDIDSWCAQNQGWNQTSCQCIMKHESGGNANAVHVNGDNSVDVGLWQINDFNWPYCSNSVAPCDAATNLECAKLVYEWGGYTWKFWVTCSICGVCDSN